MSTWLGAALRPARRHELDHHGQVDCLLADQPQPWQPSTQPRVVHGGYRAHWQSPSGPGEQDWHATAQLHQRCPLLYFLEACKVRPELRSLVLHDL